MIAPGKVLRRRMSGKALPFRRVFQKGRRLGLRERSSIIETVTQTVVVVVAAALGASLHIVRTDSCERGRLYGQMPFRASVCDLETILLSVLLRLASGKCSHDREVAAAISGELQPVGEERVLRTLASSLGNS